MPSLISRMASGSQEQVANHRTQPGSIASIADPRRGGRQCPKGSPGNSEAKRLAIIDEQKEPMASAHLRVV